MYAEQCIGHGVPAEARLYFFPHEMINRSRILYKPFGTLKTMNRGLRGWRNAGTSSGEKKWIHDSTKRSTLGTRSDGWPNQARNRTGMRPSE